MNICLYGTVFNNFNRIEESIKSVFKPNYNIVIVDSYSNDGTWEKLQELKKEYNLTLYRLKSTRGKGRDYALRHCPENSLTANFDLDTVYNENFHRALELEIPFVYVGPYIAYIANREYLIEVGGWKDLNVSEDFELLSRVKIDMFLPVIIGSNEKVSFPREKRYAKSPIKFLIRRLKNHIDYVRGRGFNNLDEYLEYLFIGTKYIPIQLIIYIIAKMKDIYRNCKNIPNNSCILLKSLKALKDPEDYGFPRDDILLLIYLEDLFYLKSIDVKLPFPVVQIYKNYILNAKTENAIIKNVQNLML